MDASRPLLDPAVPPRVPSVLQVRALHRALCQLAQERFHAPLAGKFLLADALSRGGDVFVLAASIAGAASLTPESDPSSIRYAIRNGIVDFAVTHPDEALRILKNEIRKQQPVCVCLEWSIPEALANLTARGAQPDVIAWTAAGDSALAPFLARGAALLPPQPDPPTFTLPEGWFEVEWTAGEPAGAALRRIDAAAGDVLPQEDLERQSWLHQAPRYLHRQLRSRRSIAMSGAEIETFRTVLRQKYVDGEIENCVGLRVESGPDLLLGDC